jgi:hypothetical protein
LLEFTGNELDWEQFFYALMAQGISVADPGSGGSVSGTWSVSDTYEVYGITCPGGGPLATCEDSTWGRLNVANTQLQGAGTLSADQLVRFDVLGRSRGVDDEPQP